MRSVQTFASPAIGPAALPEAAPEAASQTLHALRRRIAGLERSGLDRPGRVRRVLPVGVAAIDRHLGGGLLAGSLHEVAGAGVDLGHAAAATLFAAVLFGRQKGPVLWVLPRRDLFAPALAAAGLGPDRLILAETGHEAEVLPVAEEALHERGLLGVVAETGRLSLTASRRLQLAAEGSGATALVIRRLSPRAGAPEPDLAGTVATTRWRLAALASALPAQGGWGHPRWRVDLLRCRGGETGAWTVEGDDEAGGLRLVPDLADRSAAAGGTWQDRLASG